MAQSMRLGNGSGSEMFNVLSSAQVEKTPRNGLGRRGGRGGNLLAGCSFLHIS